MEYENKRSKDQSCNDGACTYCVAFFHSCSMPDSSGESLMYSPITYECYTMKQCHPPHQFDSTFSMLLFSDHKFISSLFLELSLPNMSTSSSASWSWYETSCSCTGRKMSCEKLKTDSASFGTKPTLDHCKHAYTTFEGLQILMASSYWIWRRNIASRQALMDCSRSRYSCSPAMPFNAWCLRRHTCTHCMHSLCAFVENATLREVFQLPQWAW